MIAIGAVLRLVPPRNMNSFYGYRSKSSLKNASTWIFANTLVATTTITFGISVCIFAVVALYSFAPFPNMDQLSCTIVAVLYPIWIYFSTERIMKRYFDEEGHLRKQFRKR